MLRFSTTLTLWVLSWTLLVAAGTAVSQRQTLRDEVSMRSLYFVGDADRGAAPAEQLNRDDLAILVAAREPVTINEMIQRGIPVRSSRLQQLIEWDLLEQQITTFVTTVPLLHGEAAEAFRADLRERLDPVVDTAAQQLRQVSEALPESHGIAALPALATWILRERVWLHLIGPSGADLARIIREQREARPERGWWGVLWYVDPSPERPLEAYAARGSDYTVLVAWDPEGGVDPFAGTQRDVILRRFLDKLDDDGREIDDWEDFATLAERGLVGPRDRVNAASARWRLDRDNFARVVEQAAVAITEAILADIDWITLSRDYGATVDRTRIVAYSQIVPLLHQALVDRGIDLDVAARDPLPGAGGAGADAGPDRPPVRVRFSDAADQDGASTEAPEDHERSVGYSAFVWRGDPPTARYRYPENP